MSAEQHRLRMATSVLPWRPRVVKHPSCVLYLDTMCDKAANFVQLIELLLLLRGI